MHSTGLQPLETFVGGCKLHLPDRIADVRCVLRVSQYYSAGTPTLKQADGGFQNLPNGDAAYAMLQRRPLQLELQDGRKWSIVIIDLQGSFTASPLD